MSDYIEQHSDAKMSLVHSAYNLQDIANALYRVGNKRLADELIEITDEILKAKTELDKAFNECFNAYTGSVQQGTANMMNGILAMAKLKKED